MPGDADLPGAPPNAQVARDLDAKEAALDPGNDQRNEMQIFVWCNDDARTCVVAARLDNLGKGASGAAVQNVNLALGLDEATGLV